MVEINFSLLIPYISVFTLIKKALENSFDFLKCRKTIRKTLQL